jgi:U4/U6.U5 tri-snRNP-associated protein 1
MTSDYFTADEMLQFKKPKKKKSHRKKEKLDLDALEAEAIASGLGAADRGSRNDGKRQSAREVEQKADAEKRSTAYQAAISKAEEASKALRQEKLPGKPVEEEELVFGDDYEDLQKSLEQARKLSLRKQDEAAGSGPQSVAELAAANKDQGDADAAEGDAQQNKVVITEMEEFVWGLQLNEGKLLTILQ